MEVPTPLARVSPGPHQQHLLRLLQCHLAGVAAGGGCAGGGGPVGQDRVRRRDCGVEAEGRPDTGQGAFSGDGGGAS